MKPYYFIMLISLLIIGCSKEPYTYLFGISILIEEDGGYRISGNVLKEYYLENERPKMLVYKTDPWGNFD
jgi:hypothetical protein